MNYSNLPVYIRKQDDENPLSFANIYDPAGEDNALYVVNKSTAQKTSIQYLNGSFGRVSGNDSNYEELFAPKINYAAPDVQIILPQFRSLVFYNLDGSRTIDPLFTDSFLPPLYLYDYDSDSNTIDYVNFNRREFYLAMRWYGDTDTYSLDYYDINNFTVANIFYASGTGFTSGWSDYSTSAYTGVVCSGLGISASGILNAINDPTGSSLYHTGDQGNTFGRNAVSGSSSVASILNVNLVETSTGYVSPYTKLTLGKAYDYIPAQNITIDYQAQNDASRLLGVDIDRDDQFTNGAALQAKISFNSYVNTETTGSLSAILDSSGENFYSIRFGNNIYNDCYLSNYDINVEPFKPVGLTASYMVNNAPVLNSNRQDFYTIDFEGSANLLLNSENLSANTWQRKLTSAFFRDADPTGGNNAWLIGSLSYSSDDTKYTIDNSQSYSYESISGVGTRLDTLTSNQDLSTYISFTGFNLLEDIVEVPKFIHFFSVDYSKIEISNNGLLGFPDMFELSEFAGLPSQPLPVNAGVRGLIAAYWRDLGSSVGSIWYQELNDRFIVEYNKVGLSSSVTNKTESFQIHLFFDPINIIEIRYKDVTPSAVVHPDAIIGIQARDVIVKPPSDGGFLPIKPDDYLSYSLSLIDFTKSLRFLPTITRNIFSSSLMYYDKIGSTKKRTFSIYLKKETPNIDGVDHPINYTLNGGLSWNRIYGINDQWQRFTFPSTVNDHQVGIQLEGLYATVSLYGPQLEDLPYSTEYIPTSGVVGVRDAYSLQIPKTIISPTIDLTTGFANTMINGNTCSISPTTGIVSNIQNSIRYSVNCGRSPIYNLGETNASDFILDTVEKQMDISSTDLQSFINFSGSKLVSDLDLTLKNAQNITGSVISMKLGANVFSQQTNLQEGDTLTTQVSIKEIVL